MAYSARMANRQSQKVERRLTAAERVRQALAAQQAAMVAGVDAAMRAHADREEHLVAADAADDRFREAVESLVQTGQSLEQIAALTDAPLDRVRAARRPKVRDGEEPADAAPAVEPRRRGRQSAVPPVMPPGVPFGGDAGCRADPPPAGEGEGEHQGEDQGESEHAHGELAVAG